MGLPQLSPGDIESAISDISHVGTPLRGGQKLVFPCRIGTTRYALKVILAPSLPTNELADDLLEDDSEIQRCGDAAVARVVREVGLLLTCASPYVVAAGPIPLRKQTIAGQSVVYFTEEWIEGGTLRQLLSSGGPLSVTETVRLARSIALAIEALSSAGIRVHRDIKPKNIMKRRATGDYVLLDMGLVYDPGEESLTDTGVLVGTIGYFSPEQLDIARKRGLDFRSDLFLLGIVLYEALTGVHPFYQAGMGIRRLAGQVMRASPPPPSYHRFDIPTQMDAVVLRLLEKRPHMRYRSCSMLVDDLKSISGS